jgi:glycosyltransferase involved in cell wall biosynthesis
MFDYMTSLKLGQYAKRWREIGMSTFSVVIPTFNRLRTIRRVLGALERQTMPLAEFEVLVIDDGSNDGTSEMLHAYRGPLRLRHFSTGLPTEEYGYLRALNVGLGHAQGRYVVFLDSDMEPAQNALENLLSAHQRWERQGINVLIRPWWVGRRPSLLLLITGRHFWAYHPARTLRRARETKFRDLHQRRDCLGPRDDVGAFMSVRLDLALAIDGFAEQVRAYGHDGEFQRRLVKIAGVRRVFEPSVFGIHGPLRGDLKATAYRWTEALRDRLAAGKRLGVTSSPR